ncbi:MAG: PHP domain-containing protein [Anaerolineales bacterium]
MLNLRAELHVHTVLSPCAGIEMIPPLIVQQALDFGLNLLAITDHNASANVAAVQKAAAGSGLTVLPGMEVQTQEEVHLLCLFDTLDQLNLWQARVDCALPPLKNDEELFGAQFVVDETGDFIRSEERLLLTSAHIAFDDAVKEVDALGGLAIPAHVNRKAFGLFANLGFLPQGLPIAAIEISRHITAEAACHAYPQIAAYPLIQSGDVHYLDDFLGVLNLQVAAPTLSEIRLAFRQQENRRMWLSSNA